MDACRHLPLCAGGGSRVVRGFCCPAPCVLGRARCVSRAALRVGGLCARRGWPFLVRGGVVCVLSGLPCSWARVVWPACALGARFAVFAPLGPLSLLCARSSPLLVCRLRLGGLFLAARLAAWLLFSAFVLRRGWWWGGWSPVFGSGFRGLSRDLWLPGAVFVGCPLLSWLGGGLLAGWLVGWGGVPCGWFAP